MSISLNNLKPAKGAVKKRKRIARGQGSGKGGTAGKGHKGAQSRSGYKSKRGFEGGQTPLQRRLPKGGFKNPTGVEFEVINLANLQALADKFGVTDFTYEKLREMKIIQKSHKLKVLANGDLTTKINIHAHAFSAKAKESIEKLGGVATII